MKTFDLQTVVYREGKYFVSQCLNVDVSSFGDTESEALANLKEALELYFEDAGSQRISEVKSPEVKRLTLQSA